MESININFFEWPSFQSLLRVRLHDDEAAIILKGHLLTEYLLNRIIEKKLTDSTKFLKLTFSQKVKELCNRGLLSGPLQENVERLNRFRNKLVHQLDFSINKKDMLFANDSGEVVNLKLKKTRFPERQYYRLFCNAIITKLAYHMMVNLNVDPRFVEYANKK